jgi:DNA (cytosine-5)-methyltransferase 1
VDVEYQPNYPFEFHQADALFVLQEGLARGFDAIHASPPCQAFTTARVIHGRDHPDLLTPTRALFEQTDIPWVIENVPGAPMRPDIKLCGCMFPELRSENGMLARERWFEFHEPVFGLRAKCHHPLPVISVFGHGGHVYHGVQDWRQVMGIDWMKRDELAQAIPPAYTEHVGSYLMAALARGPMLAQEGHLDVAA